MRVGVIGVGQHASTNLYPNLRVAGLDLVAVCSQNLVRAQAAAKFWGAEFAFDDAEAMLRSVDLQGVLISVPPSSYRELITLCLSFGRPVFCEKPGASTSNEATSLASLSARASVPIVVGYMKRFAPTYAQAHDIIRSPEFAPVTLGSFTFAMGRGFGGDLRTYLIDNPVHHLDLARFLIGDLVDLEARVAAAPGNGHAVAAAARTSAGAVCTFNFCTTGSWMQRNEHIEVFGNGTSLSVDNVDTLTLRPPDRPERVWRPNYTVPTPENSTPHLIGIVPELIHFRQMALGEVTKNASDMASAARTLLLAEQLCAIAGV